MMVEENVCCVSAVVVCDLYSDSGEASLCLLRFGGGKIPFYVSSYLLLSDTEAVDSVRSRGS